MMAVQLNTGRKGEAQLKSSEGSCYLPQKQQGRMLHRHRRTSSTVVAAETGSHEGKSVPAKADSRGGGLQGDKARPVHYPLM